MLALARRHQAAQEREPQDDLLQVVGAGRDVNPERPAESVGERQERRGEQRADEQGVLEPAQQAGERGLGGRGEAAVRSGSFRLAHRAAAGWLLRYSSR